MDDPGLPLSRTFLAAAGRAVPWQASAALEACLRGLWQAGQGVWPDIVLAAEELATHTAQHLPEQLPTEPEEFLHGLAATDLFLACACTQGLAAAIEAFDGSFLERVPAYLAHMNQAPAFGEEVLQILREKILVGSATGPPKIAEYAGLGSLGSWVRVSAVRTALNLLRGEREVPDGGEQGAYQMAADSDPELRLLRQRYQQEFREAVQEAVRALSGEQRNVLHLYFVGGLSTPQIGALFKVSHSTVVRWLAAARRSILEKTRRRLREQVGLTSAEFDSLARVLHSQLDVSLAGLLKASQA